MLPRKTYLIAMAPLLFLSRDFEELSDYSHLSCMGLLAGARMCT